MAAAVLLLLSACGTNGVPPHTIMESSFSTSVPADSTDKKAVYINEGREKLALM